jgi:putative protease
MAGPSKKFEPKVKPYFPRPTMNEKPNPIELLAPAGTPEKLEIALHYGADAVYLAGKDFSLRNFSANFSLEEMQAARRLTREQGVRMYVAVNIYSRDSETRAIADYLDALGGIEPDALIVADPAVFMLARKRLSQIPIHISTQANTTNTGTAASGGIWVPPGSTRPGN